MSNAFSLENYKLEGEELKIFTFPAPILKKKASPVTIFDAALTTLAKDMLYTMYNAPGIGLAAPQVGVLQRMFVIDVDFEREKITKADDTVEYKLSNFSPRIFINPVITKKEGEIIHEEGCLSVPGIYEKVQRAEKITVEYFDLTGNKQLLEADDILAICIQHEFDHLEGIVFLERLSLIKRNMLKKKILKEQNKTD